MGLPLDARRAAPLPRVRLTVEVGLASCALDGRPAAALLRQSAGCLKVSDYEEGDVRVTTALNRMLELPGAWVRDVELGERAMIVTVALRRRKPICSGCGAHGLPIKDHRVKRWRHLDVGGVRCQVE